MVKPKQSAAAAEPPDGAPPIKPQKSRSSWTPSLKKVLRGGGGSHHHHERSSSESTATAASSTSPSSLSAVTSMTMQSSSPIVTTTTTRPSTDHGPQASPPNHLLSSASYSSSSNNIHSHHHQLLGKLSEDDIVADDDDLMAPPPPLATPPGTPQKLWERQYKNFLSRSKKSSSRNDLLDTTTETTQTPLTMATADSLDHRKSHSSSSNHRLSAATTTAATAHPGNSCSHNNSLEESSVRGGQFFASVFGHNKSLQQQRRSSKHNNNKSSSQDELDGTLRRGSERGHAQQQQQQQQYSSTSLSSSASHASSSHGIAGAAAHPRPPASSSSSSLPNFYPMPQQQRYTTTHSSETTTAGIPDALRGPAFIGRILHEPSASNHDVTAAAASAANCDNAHVNTATTASAMKRAFTEFHNETGRDAASAFLGDDPSHRNGRNVAVHRLQSAMASTSLLSSSLHNGIMPPMSSSSLSSNCLFPRSLPAAHAVAGAGNTTSSSSSHNDNCHRAPRLMYPTNLQRRILKPLMAVESWQPGRRYVIAPAVWTACPMGVMAALTKNSLLLSAKEACTNEDGRPSGSLPFGTILLGQCLVQSVVDGKTLSQNDDDQWTPALFVLRQNYLLEYGPSDPLGGLPRGYAHLQHSTCCINTDYEATLELDFYGSSCAKSDRRRLLVRPSQCDDCPFWLQCLNTAGTLGISELYDYDESKPLGTGSYATVYAAKRKCPSAPEGCALKVFCKTMFWRCVIKGRERADTIVREVSVQATLTARCSDVHSFLRIRGFFETADHVVIESEYLDGMDLFRYISSRPRSTEAEAACIIYNIMLCLRAMNRIGLSHRDVKPANILVAHTKQPLTVKVADFGLSTFVGVDGKVSGRCGTPGYVAPEIFHAGVHGAYSKKVDVFSAGVTLYVMLCGYEPFYGESDSELIRANKEAVVEFPAEDWKAISQSARDLVSKMLLADPGRRLSVEQAITHPWIIEHVHQGGVDVPSPAQEMPLLDACIVS